MTDLTEQPMSLVPRGTHLDVAVFNRAAFDGTAAFLEADAVVSYLRTIAGRGAALQVKLRTSGTLQAVAAEVAEEAHTLAGSASMFGLDRVAQAARLLEAAIENSAPGVTALATDLDTAISDTNDVIEGLAPGSGPGTDAYRCSVDNGMERPR